MSHTLTKEIDDGSKNGQPACLNHLTSSSVVQLSLKKNGRSGPINHHQRTHPLKSSRDRQSKSSWSQLVHQVKQLSLIGRLRHHIRHVLYPIDDRVNIANAIDQTNGINDLKPSQNLDSNIDGTAPATLLLIFFKRKRNVRLVFSVTLEGIWVFFYFWNNFVKLVFRLF